MKVQRINKQLLASKNKYVQGYRAYELDQPLSPNAHPLAKLGYEDAEKYYANQKGN